MTLALDYRPNRFAEVVGQLHIKPILKAMVKTQSVPPALLFVGTRGTGKTTSARILAAALNCKSSTDGDACAECESCLAVQNGTSFSVLEVDAASNGLVGDIRKIKEMVAYAHEGDWRVVMLDEAHSMSKEAFNALLKVLEEPPPFTVFVLLTTEANKILETVVSRSMSFDFRRMTLGDITGRLRHISDEQQLGATDELLVEIATRAQGGMRDAVMLLDQVSRVGITDVTGFRELFGIKDVSAEILTAAMNGEHAKGASIIEDYFHRVGDASGMVNDLVSLTRDLLIAHSGGEIADPERVAMVRRTDIGKLVSVVRVLWDLKTRVRAVDNDQRAAMHMAFALISDVFREKTKVVSIASSNGHADEPKLTLADMRLLAERQLA